MIYIKKMVAALLALCACQAASAQALEVQHRAFSNPAAMGEEEALSVALFGQYRLYGFDGAPQRTAIQATMPFTVGRYSGRVAEMGNPNNMFAGLTAEGASVGVHRSYNAVLGYAYQLHVSAASQLAFGVALGASGESASYRSLLDGADYDPEVLRQPTSTAWKFHSQAGVEWHGERYYVSLYSPAILEYDYLLQAGYHSAVGSSSESSSSGYYESESTGRQSAWEIHGQGGMKGGELLLQAEAVFTIRGLLGIGLSWQYPSDMAALAMLSINRFKIGYAYQFLTLNPLLPQHEIVVKIRLARKGDGE
jgi:type IX secretion system PorP/SprF family membrane protein